MSDKQRGWSIKLFNNNGYLFKLRTEPSKWVLIWGIREYRYIIIRTQTVGHHHASATQDFLSNQVSCNCQDGNLCPWVVLVLVCFYSLVGFKTRIKVAGGHSVLFQWHGYILRHKNTQKNILADRHKTRQPSRVYITPQQHTVTKKNIVFTHNHAKNPCWIFSPCRMYGIKHSNSAWRTERTGGWPRVMVFELPLEWFELDNISVLPNSPHTSRVDVQTFVHRDKK